MLQSYTKCYTVFEKHRKKSHYWKLRAKRAMFFHSQSMSQFLSHFWRYVTLLKVRHICKVCHICKGQCIEGMSHFWRYVTLLKVYHTYEGLSKLWRYVTLLKVCQTYEDMSKLWRYVKITNISLCYLGNDNNAWLEPNGLCHRSICIFIYPRALFCTQMKIDY